MSLVLSICLSAALASTTPSDDAVPADLILAGGRIVTLDADHPEGTAIAIRNGRVLQVGTDEAISELGSSSTRRIALDGALVIPGFIEGHGHFLGIGDMRMQLDLNGTSSFQAITNLVERAVETTEPGVLIRGRGWHQSKWSTLPKDSVQGLPRHNALSAVTPDNPVILRHASGHAAFANAYAMRLAGIDRDTPDPTGGEIVRDKRGKPIGIFREEAMELLAPVYANSTQPDSAHLAELARDECLSKGITSFHDAGSPLEVAELYLRMADEGKLGPRMFVMLSDSNERLAEELPDHPLLRMNHTQLRVGGIKRSIDGALGSHGAWLLEPYEDHRESSGLNTLDIESLKETARLALEHNLQLCVHAIGDRANREALDIFETSFKSKPERTDFRWRIEHAQHLHPDDAPRFAALSVIASMQSVHCTSDAAFVVDRLGETRARSGAYLWRTLTDLGVVVTNGTDAPVEDVAPIANFYSAVTRRTKSGEPFFEDQRLSRMEALRGYTVNNAYASFEEDRKGSLAPGLLADITVLSRDILTIPVEEIPSTEVLYTIVGGRVLYSRDK